MKQLTENKKYDLELGLFSVVRDKSKLEREAILIEAGSDIIRNYNTQEEIEGCLYEERK